MNILDRSAILIGICVRFISLFFHIGAGGTWPGEIVLKLQSNILSYFVKRFSKGVILVAGTNGKTTTSLMIKQILEKDGKRVVHNDSGANLLNGLVSACIQQTRWNGSFEADWGVFEVDENSLPVVLKFVNFLKKSKVIIVFLNLFRDQLDRYGELDVIAEKWEESLRLYLGLTQDDNGLTTLILNADDPLITHLNPRAGLEARVWYFGVTDKKLFLKRLEHATDSTFCLNCGARLEYDGIYFSHIGIWKCTKCSEKRPTPNVDTWKSPLPGLYNMYNTLAAVSVAKNLGYKDSTINQALSSFIPAFGRQEEFEIEKKKVKIFLSKNPASFNVSIRAVLEFKPHVMLLVLNDRIPDGRDVSWIWDVDFEMISSNITVIISGDRAYDMGVRMKYAIKTQKQNSKEYIFENLKEAISLGLKEIRKGETLYILPTYSAMLEIRKILIGKKIL